MLARQQRAQGLQHCVAVTVGGWGPCSGGSCNAPTFSCACLAETLRASQRGFYTAQRLQLVLEPTRLRVQARAMTGAAGPGCVLRDSAWDCLKQNFSENENAPTFSSACLAEMVEGWCNGQAQWLWSFRVLLPVNVV